MDPRFGLPIVTIWLVLGGGGGGGDIGLTSPWLARNPCGKVAVCRAAETAGDW